MMIFSPFLKDEHFMGTWFSKRLILDHYNDIKVIYRGQMTVSSNNIKKTIISEETEKPNCHDILYVGTLWYENKFYNCSQSYILNSHFDKVDINFYGGNHFFSLNRSESIQSIFHGCSPDKYFGIIKLINSENFTITWNVLGDKKNYYLRSSYQKKKPHSILEKAI